MTALFVADGVEYSVHRKRVLLLADQSPEGVSHEHHDGIWNMAAVAKS
jgi:hypothetical protein